MHNIKRMNAIKADNIIGRDPLRPTLAPTTAAIRAMLIPDTIIAILLVVASV